MIAFAEMLVEAAKKAGMKVPDDAEDFDQNDYPHFAVFCNAQLARRVVYHGEHWDNAKVIAGIAEDDIRKVTVEDLISRGFSIAF